MRRRILRLFGWLLTGLVVLIALLAGAIRVDQYLLRRRTERLQTDIRSLELRKGTYEDARQLEGRWFEVRERRCLQAVLVRSANLLE